MKDKIVFITGGNSGIGKATAIDLAKMGATVVIMARNKTKGLAAIEDIKKVSKVAVDLIVGDLSSFASIRQAAATFNEKYDRLDVLINNAGLVAKEFTKTEDGFETQFAVNHLGHYLLTNLLQDKLKSAPKARVINVSSDLHLSAKFDVASFKNAPTNYATFGAYGQSKLCNVLFTKALAKHFKNDNISVNALHPGVVATSIIDNDVSSGWKFLWNIGKIFFKSPKNGAATSVYLASSKQVEGVTGSYFSNKKEKAPSKLAQDEALIEQLWKLSEEYTSAKF